MTRESGAPPVDHDRYLRALDERDDARADADNAQAHVGSLKRAIKQICDAIGIERGTTNWPEWIQGVRDEIARLRDGKNTREFIDEAEAAATRLRSRSDGHREPCLICGELCSTISANPAFWPLRIREDGWHHTGCVSDALQELALRPAAVDGTRWRHEARGSLYVELARSTLQKSGDYMLGEGDRLVTYRGVDGRIWSRYEPEFNDGRFKRDEMVDAASAPAHMVERAKVVAERIYRLWGDRYIAAIAEHLAAVERETRRQCEAEYSEAQKIIKEAAALLLTNGKYKDAVELRREAREATLTEAADIAHRHCWLPAVGAREEGPASRIEDAIRALSLTAPQAGWRAIDTAPRDQNLLLFGLQTTAGDEGVRYYRPLVFAGYWDPIDEAWCATGSRWDGPFFEPTHWMPLPSPPTEDTKP